METKSKIADAMQPCSMLKIGHVRHLGLFFEKAAADKAFNPTHLSLYMALFQSWNLNNFKSPVSISREELMRISKISSKATYHKCLKALHASGYIRYEPSFNSFKGSQVYLLDFINDTLSVSRHDK